MKRSIVVFSLLCLDLQATHASQFLNFAENKRLEATICGDALNRIAVANDRITQVFGDEGTFESQNDETTGQLFLKPTAENGTKNLSLTLITEQGITQDLTLKPTTQTPATIILKNVSKQPEAIVLFEKNFPFQEQLLTLMRQAVLGQLTVVEDEPIIRVASEGYQITYDQSFQAGPYVVYTFFVESQVETDIEIQEKIFYRPGDLALSFQDRVLSPGSKTRLYVVSRA